MNPNEYNALMHAIWRLDRTIKQNESTQEFETKFLKQLRQERQSLLELFNRL